MVTPPCARDGYGVDFLNLERMKISEVKITDIIQDDKNLNKGTADGKAMITKSLQKFGAGRSILLDKNNRIIAGNKTHENAEEIGMEDVIVVESDGSKLVAVKRTDIDLDSKEGREMALADNATVKVDLSWDDDAMREVSETWGIDTEEWGVELDGATTDNPYTMKVESPVYEITGDCPSVSELFDCEKADELLHNIPDNIDAEIRDFLRLAAMRHVIFDYGKIAAYYAHAPKSVQTLMEESALVIIDFNKAIEGGYVELREDIRQLMRGDVFND